MSWRIVAINNPARLRCISNQLVISQEENYSIPLEDLDAVIIDGHGITITANTITKLTTVSTSVVVCDDKHMPSAVVLPYSQHSRQAKVSREQIGCKIPLKKQLWHKIIKAKIENQAACLDFFEYDSTRLVSLAKEVKSGDSTNRESLAARIYFAKLLENTTRRMPLWHNAALNYGYAMVRSHIARHVAARGLISSIGIFHKSELNGFNLVDDIIEAYRPVVDKFILSSVVRSHLDGCDASLTLLERKQIIDILNYDVTMKNKRFPIKYAVEMTVDSFADCVSKNDPELILLPKL